MPWPELLACVVALLLAVSYRWLPSLHTVALAGKMPGPLVSFNLFLNALDGIIPAVMKQFQTHGPVVRLWVGPFLFVMIKDPDDIREVLGNAKIVNRDSDSIRILRSVFGESLITAQDETWRTHKKLISPAFNAHLLQTYVAVFGRKAVLLTDALSRLCDGRTFDVHHLLALCALDAVCETAIGTTVNTQTVGHSDLANSINETSGLVVRRFSRLWLHLDLIYAMTSEGRKAKQNLKIFHSFSEAVIAQKLKEFRNGVHSPSVVLTNDRKVSSFLEMLIQASETQGSILSPDEIRDAVTAITLTGIEGTATTMSMFLLVVAMHPEIQARLQQELDGVFGTDPRPATSEDLNHLPFMDRCIKETMRLFPIGVFLHRELKEDLLLASGYALPAGCKVIVVPYATHRDPRFFPEPFRFWPDRWLPENVVHSHPYAYLPFSMGVRNCIGQKYAMLQMRSVLGQILREYTVSTSVNMETLVSALQLTLVLSVKKELGYPVQLTRRDRGTCQHSTADTTMSALDS